MRIVDPDSESDTMRDCEVGEVGEIWIRSAQVMLGYWNMPEETEKAVTPDGWFRTGDYGYLDDDGYLHIAGRNDDMITMNGMKFSPLEIEERIREFFPGYEFCVVGISDPAGVLGQIPVFCYAARNGDVITASELSRLLSDKIDRNKIPRVVYRVDPARLLDGKLARSVKERIGYRGAFLTRTQG